MTAFAPGPGTAAALSPPGLPTCASRQTTFDSEGLLALPALTAVSGKRVADLSRRRRARPARRRRCARAARRVDYVDCYRRAAPQSGADGLVEALRDGPRRTR